MRFFKKKTWRYVGCVDATFTHPNVQEWTVFAHLKERSDGKREVRYEGRGAEDHRYFRRYVVAWLEGGDLPPEIDLALTPEGSKPKKAELIVFPGGKSDG